MTDIVRGSRELLLVAERMAMDKGIQAESIIKAMEDGIKLAARKKYGTELNVECVINRKNGDIGLYNVLEVIPDSDLSTINTKTQITLNDAVEKVRNEKALFQENVEVGGTIKVELPPVDLNRLAVQIAKNEIIKKVKEAEKEKEYDEFIGKVGTIINGTVKKLGQKNIVVEVDGYETLLNKENLIPGEHYRIGDRIRAYVADVVKGIDNQIFLSRTDNNFLVELLKQEVAEVYDGMIEVKNVAREPGSKAKITVYSRDNITDVVGTCVGPRGAKIQAVSSELRGEKIDVIKWSDDPAQLVANLLSPSKVTKVVIDDNKGTIDVIVSQDQLNLAIGRSGQNIRLASRIIGGRINILTEEEEKIKRTNKFNDSTNLFINALDVEEVIAQLLVADGYSTVEELAGANVEELQKIEGFDEDIAIEIKNRAEEYMSEIIIQGKEEDTEISNSDIKKE